MTFRAWFLGLGLSCFGAVLGQIFVRRLARLYTFAHRTESLLCLSQYFRPQTISVSQLFLQIIGYILGRVMSDVIPGPGNPHGRLQTSDTWFWRWLNPGPFSSYLYL